MEDQSHDSKETQTCTIEFEKYLSSLYDDENESYAGLTLCPICSQPWAADTDHRIVSLKCGHIFGEKCIIAYRLNKSNHSASKCPSCAAPFRKSDFRFLFAKTIVAVDKSEELKLEHAARKEASLHTVATIERNNIYTNMKLFQNQLHGLKVQRQDLRVKIEKLKARLGAHPVPTHEIPEPPVPMCIAPGPSLDNESSLGNFVKIYDSELMSKGDCRIIISSEQLGIIACSQKSNVDLFEGYGVRTIGLSDFRPKMFIPLHKAQIKDIAFHPLEPVILTASLDKTVKQSNIHQASIISSFQVEDSAWSCTWNQSNPICFFVGLRNGRVLEYDVRAPHIPLNELKTVEKLPVASLSYVYNSTVKGVICTRLRGCEFYAHKTTDLFERFNLPLIGNFTSAYFDNSISNLLVSSRPFKRNNNITHSVYNLQFAMNESEKSCIFSCIPIQEYHGGIRADHVLRSKIYPHPSGNGYLVCVGDQETNGFLVWDSNLSKPLLKMNIGAPVFDSTLIRPPNTDPHLVCLTDSRLVVHKWSP